MTICDPKAWQDFLAEIPLIKDDGLTGDALWQRIERAWRPLLVGACPDDKTLIYHHAMFRLACEGIIPREWGVRH